MRKRRLSTRLLALLVMVCQGAAVQLALAKEAAHSDQDSARSSSVAQLGYPAGLLIAENTLPQRYSLLFPLPSAMGTDGGKLRLFYRAVAPFSANGALVVTLNDQREERVSLAPDGAVHEWSLLVTAEELKEGQLKVAIAPDGEGECSESPQRSFRVRLLPTSNLQVTYRDEPATLRDFWLTLPREVRLSLPAGELDEELFAKALEWVALLQRSNYTVRIVRLPEVGEIVLAPRSEIAPALSAKKERGERWELPWRGKKNIGLIESDSGRLMVVTEPYPSAEVFSEEWHALGATAALASTVSPREAAAMSVPLTAFDIDSSEVTFRGKQQWHGTVTPWKLPPGTRPVAAVVKMRVPKAAAGERLRIYVYVNDRLAASELLPEGGSEYQLKVPFREVRDDNIYRMRIIVRSNSRERCVASSEARIEIDAASHLLVENNDRRVREFAALPTAYGHGFDLIVPQETRLEAERYLPMMGEVLSSFAVAPFDYRLVFYTKGEALLPERNFIMIANALPQKMHVALRLDKGWVEVVDRQGELLVGDEQLRKGMVLQVARSDEHGGLWIYPGQQDSLPFVDVGLLGSTDVAVYADNHRVISIDTHQYGLTHIRYVGTPNWIEHLYEERRLWLLGAWLLLTLAMLYLYVIPKRQRNLS